MRKRTGYLIRRGKVFYAVWTVAHKKIMRTTGKHDRREAEKELHRIMEPFVAGDEVATLQNIAARIEGRTAELTRFEDERNPPLVVSAAWTAFERSTLRPDSGERTLAQYNAEFRRFASWLQKAHPETQTMREVTPTIAKAYAQDLAAAKVSASTFNQHRNFLRLLWRTLAQEAKTAVNPWDVIARKQLQTLAHRKRALTPAQFEALLAIAEAEPDLRDLLLVLAWTGLRLVDVVKLRWESVDFSKSVLTVYPQKTARRTGKAVHIPVFPVLAEVLNRRQAALPTLNAAQLVFPNLADAYDRDMGSTLSKRLRIIFEKAGLQTAEERAGLERSVVLYGAHSLRHFFVTTAAAAGMPAAMIKAITGHATDGMLEHYQHISAEIAGEFAHRLGNGSKKSTPTLLPAKTRDEELRKIIGAMTPKTCKKDKARALALLNGIERNP